MDIIERLLNMCRDIRRKPIPVSGVIPLMQEASAELARLRAENERQTAALVEAGKLLQGTPLDAIYAEADRFGCRLPSGDSPEGYSITLSLKNLRTEG